MYVMYFLNVKFLHWYCCRTWADQQLPSDFSGMKSNQTVALDTSSRRSLSFLLLSLIIQYLWYIEPCCGPCQSDDCLTCSSCLYPRHCTMNSENQADAISRWELQVRAWLLPDIIYWSLCDYLCELIFLHAHQNAMWRIWNRLSSFFLLEIKRKQCQEQSTAPQDKPGYRVQLQSNIYTTKSNGVNIYSKETFQAQTFTLSTFLHFSHIWWYAVGQPKTWREKNGVSKHFANSSTAKIGKEVISTRNLHLCRITRTGRSM